MVVTPGPGDEGGTGAGWASRGARVWPAGGWDTRWALLGTPLKRRRMGGSAWCCRTPGWFGGGGGAVPSPSTNIVTSPTSKSSSGGCRRWSAASSSETPPGYVARAWFRYRAASLRQCVLRAWHRAGALLWRDVADPAPVSRRVSPKGQGPARPVGCAPPHAVPVEGCLGAYEPLPDGVHDLVHCRA